MLLFFLSALKAAGDGSAEEPSQDSPGSGNVLCLCDEPFLVLLAHPARPLPPSSITPAAEQGTRALGGWCADVPQDALFLSSELHQFLPRLYLPSCVWQRRSHTRFIGNAVLQLFSCFLLFWRNLALTSRPRAACLQHLTLRLGSSFLLQQKRHSSSAQGGNPSPLYSFLFSVPSM